jgi:hypothetical protein
LCISITAKADTNDEEGNDEEGNEDNNKPPDKGAR